MSAATTFLGIDRRPHLWPEVLPYSLLAAVRDRRDLTLTQERILRLAGVPAPRYDFARRTLEVPTWDSTGRRWTLAPPRPHQEGAIQW